MNLSDKKVFNNMSWIIICKIIQSFLGLIINRFTANYLGTENFGALNYAITVTTFVLPIAQLGLSAVIVQEVVTKDGKDGEILGSAIFMSFISSILCYVLILIYVKKINVNEIETIVCCATYGLSLFAQAFQLIVYWFQAKLLSKYISIVSIIAYLITSIYKIVLLVCKADLWLFALSYSIDFCVISILGFYLYKKRCIFRFKIKMNIIKELFKSGRHFIISGLMVTIFAQTDKLMLKQMMGNYEIGVYSAAFSCASSFSFVFVAMIDSFRPVIFECRESDSVLFEKNMKTMFSVLIYSSLFMGILFCIFSKIIVHLLFGLNYLEAAPILCVVVWHTMFSYIGSCRDMWILANGKQNLLWILNLIGALINCLLNYFFIKKFGVIGAAWASVISQFFMYMGLGFVFRPIRRCTQLLLQSLNIEYIFDFVKDLILRKEKSEQF